MDFLVLVKQVPDLEQVKADASTQAPLTSGIARKISDFDKNAIEAALRLRQVNPGKVALLTVGVEDARQVLKEALAMGGDVAYEVVDPGLAGSDQTSLANIISAAIKKIGLPQMILCGESSIDEYAGQIGPRVAQALGWSHVAYARKIEIVGNEVKVERDMEDQTETVSVAVPVLVTVTKEINEPRLPPLMQIMQAGKKPLTQWSLADLAIDRISVGDAASKMKVVNYSSPRAQRKSIRIEGDAEQAAMTLARKLVEEGLVKG